MAIENKIKRQIAFSPTTWERLNELSDRMDTPISTLVNLGIAWWMDYHDLFKMVPELLAAMQNVEEVVGNRVSQIEGGNLEGDST
jgi:hypothetical protein